MHHMPSRTANDMWQHNYGLGCGTTEILMFCWLDHLFLNIEQVFLKAKEIATHSNKSQRQSAEQKKKSDTKKHLLCDLLCMAVQEGATLIWGENLYWYPSGFPIRAEQSYRKSSIAFFSWVTITQVYTQIRNSSNCIFNMYAVCCMHVFAALKHLKYF